MGSPGKWSPWPARTRRGGNRFARSTLTRRAPTAHLGSGERRPSPQRYPPLAGLPRASSTHGQGSHRVTGGRSKVAVVGAGYVGLTTAVCLSHLGKEVVACA